MPTADADADSEAWDVFDEEFERPSPREEANGEADEEPVNGVVSWSEVDGLLARLKEWRSEPPEELVRVLRDQLADRQTTSAGCTHFVDHDMAAAWPPR